MEELGVSEGGLASLARAVYAQLGLRTYFTAGEQEVRAWTFKEGMTAPQAAGVIHTDFERGFIKVRQSIWVVSCTRFFWLTQSLGVQNLCKTRVEKEKGE